MKKRFLPVAMAQRCLGLITANVAADCSNPMFAGDEIIIYLANKSEIASYTYNGSNPLIVEAITMSGAATFFTLTGVTSSNNSKTSLDKQKLGSGFIHEIEAVVLNDNGATKAQLELYAKGVLTIIVEHKRKGASGASAFEIFGKDQGLELAVLNRDQSSSENKGAYTIAFKTLAGLNEPHLPAPLFVTSYAASAAVVAGLL